jgi:hypothetical protein
MPLFNSEDGAIANSQLPTGNGQVTARLRGIMRERGSGVSLTWQLAIGDWLLAIGS